MQEFLAVLDATMDVVALTGEQRRLLKEGCMARLKGEVMPVAPIGQPAPNMPMTFPVPNTYGVPPMQNPTAMNMPIGFAAVQPTVQQPLPPGMNMPLSLTQSQPPIEWTPPGGPDPKKHVTELDIADRLENILREQKAERSSVPFTKGIFDAIFIGVAIGIATMVAGLVLSREPSLLIIYGLQTLLLIVLIVVFLYVLGSIHESTWGGKRKYGIILTILRGIVGPLTAPLGTLVCLHELVWGRAYAVNLPGRIMRSLIAPLSIPVGLAWDLSGGMMGIFGMRSSA